MVVIEAGAHPLPKRERKKEKKRRRVRVREFTHDTFINKVTYRLTFAVCHLEINFKKHKHAHLHV